MGLQCTNFGESYTPDLFYPLFKRENKRPHENGTAQFPRDCLLTAKTKLCTDLQMAAYPYHE